MKDILDAFDKAYIINVADRRDRYVQTVKEFARFGIDVPSPRVAFHIARRPVVKGAFPTLGARGSFTSHLAVLERALSERAQNVLIFEDDVRFTAAAHSASSAVAAALRRVDWDVVYLGYLSPTAPTGSGPLMVSTAPTRGGHAYGVNARFMGEMAHFMRECERRPAGDPDGGPMFRDGAYNHIRQMRMDLKVYLAVPNLATQRSSRTDLHRLRIYDRIKMLSPVISTMRAMRNALRK